jgi:hypothetical protein
VSVLTILPIQLLVKTLASIFWDRDWVAWAAVGFFSLAGLANKSALTGTARQQTYRNVPRTRLSAARHIRRLLDPQPWARSGSGHGLVAVKISPQAAEEFLVAFFAVFDCIIQLTFGQLARIGQRRPDPYRLPG